MTTIRELKERVNDWQGKDQQVTLGMMEALVWTMSHDPELFDRFKERVAVDRFEYESERAAVDGE